MIIYSEKGSKLTVKIVFEIENIPDDANLNKVIAYGLINLEEKKVKVRNSEEIGVY